MSSEKLTGYEIIYVMILARYDNNNLNDINRLTIGTIRYDNKTKAY